MATNPDNPKPPGGERKTATSYDHLLDPLPVPDVVESDSDTAWGLWEHTLQGDSGSDDAAQKEVSFDDTIPSELAELPPLKPKA